VTASQRIIGGLSQDINESDPLILAAGYVKDKLQDSRLFGKVVQSSSCSGPRMVSVEGKITSLIHNRGKFRASFQGRIVNCKNGETISRFDASERVDAQELDKMSGNIADTFLSEIKKKVSCRKSEPA